MIYFVSGHLDLTEAELEEHYVPRLVAAIAEGATFVVGDARGCDAMVQRFLAGRIAHERVCVFHMLAAPRNLAASFATCGGFATDAARDAAMTTASTADIAWVRPGRELSGTARNIARRRHI